MKQKAFETIAHEADICVVGGGLAGLCAAVSAARHGAQVVLMQERPVLGGNASSEIRMWVSGAQGKNNKETGIIEELWLENHYRNPNKNYSIWDGILYDLAVSTPGITLLLNCTCNECEMDGQKIFSVTGWQMTTQTYHCVKAQIFIDCSGDSVLAPLSGAEYMLGTESKYEYDESTAPETGSKSTMGMSCLLQAVEEDTPSTFIPPAWANRYTREDLAPYRLPNMEKISENFWYIELGGDMDSIKDTEHCRDELLKIAYGLWDYIKNAPENKEKNQFWRLSWVGMLPGKRESRRYVGDHIMVQNELRAGGHFDDVIAYGGWSIDTHHPAGFRTKEPPTIYHPAPSPYGIPYRCLYSVNVENLMFAGRNISVTHAVTSSARVMGTCALLGQAAGTAASIAARERLSPREIFQQKIDELQQTLLEDDCYLPGIPYRVPALTQKAALNCAAENAEALRDGVNRPVGDDDHGCTVALNASITYTFEEKTAVSRIRLVFDSDLEQETLPPYEKQLKRGMLCNLPRHFPDTYVPKTMTKAYRIEGLTDSGWVALAEEDNNYQRLRVHSVSFAGKAIRFIPLSTWGNPACHLFEFEVS